MSCWSQSPRDRGAKRPAPATKRVRVVLVCGYALMRAGLRALLEKSPSLEVVGEAGDISAALRLLLARRPDVVFFDLAVFGFDGLKTVVKTARELPGLGIVVLSTQATQDQVHQVLRAGATGLVLRYSPAHELALAIQAVARGEIYLSAAIPRHVRETCRQPVNGLTNPLDRLTPRQREVLQFITESKTTKEIALQLGISAKTVEFHRAQTMSRLGIGDVPALVRFALRVGLVPL